MEFSIKAASPEKLKTGCVAVPVFASGKLAPAAQELDRAAKGHLSRILKQGDFDPKPGATLMLYGVPGKNYRIETTTNPLPFVWREIPKSQFFRVASRLLTFRFVHPLLQTFHRKEPTKQVLIFYNPHTSSDL